MHTRDLIKVEHDCNYAAEADKWTVVYHHRNGWTILYRGNYAECRRHAQIETDLRGIKANL